MTMKRLLALLLTALLILPCLAGTAFAEGISLTPPSHPTGGVPVSMLTPGEITPTDASNANRYTLSTSRTPTMGQTTTFTVMPNSGSGITQCKFQMCIDDEFKAGEGYVSTLWMDKVWKGTSFSYTFYQPGEYWLYVTCGNSGGSIVEEGWATHFTVAPNSSAPSLQKKVAEVAAQCRASVSGEYNQALWLHDWITSHCYYDLALENYSAEALFFKGTTVCDGYSKAYSLLLSALGIQNVRVFGDETLNHAWNAARIEGNWCQIDATWDDPSGAYTAVSGDECHDYFGLNTYFMSLDHPHSAPVSCTSLANCYVYRTKQYKTWLYYALLDPNSETVYSQLSAGKYDFNADTKGRMVIDISTLTYYDGYTYPNYVNGKFELATACLQEESFQILNRFTVPVRCVYDSSTFKIRCIANLDEYTLTLPSALTSVDAQAFQNASGFLAVKLGEGVKSIGSLAFANCPTLVKIVIPYNQVSIASDAFQGDNRYLVIVCHQGSAADSYARSKGMWYQYN